MSKRKTRSKSKGGPPPGFITLPEVLHDIERKIPYAIFWNVTSQEAWKIEDLVTAIDLADPSIVIQLAEALNMHPHDILEAPVFNWGATKELRAAIAVGSPRKATTVFVEMIPEELETEGEFEASA